MSYRVFTASSLQALFHQHHTLFVSSPLFGQQHLFVTQNVQTIDWIKRSLADQYTVHFARHYTTPSKALKALVDACQLSQIYSHIPMVMAENAIDGAYNLTMLIYQQLDQAYQSHDVQYQHLLPLLQSSPYDALWALASQVAYQFEQYAKLYPHVIHSWRDNQPLSFEQVHPSMQIWQQALWYQLFGTSQPSYLLLHDLIDRIVLAQSPYQGAITQVVLLGNVFLSPTEQALLVHLGQYIEITHLMVMPMHYQTLPFFSSHTPLAHKVAQLWQHQNIPQVASPPPVVRPNHTLSALQHTLITGQQHQSATPWDESIQWFAISDPEREIETVKDYILHFLAQDSTIRLHDIAILAPDISAYTSYIQAIFYRGYDDGTQLPYSMISHSDSFTSPISDAMIQLLQLPLSRFDIDTLFTLFENTAFMLNYRINQDDIAKWRQFCTDASILYGKDVQHQQHHQLGSHEKHTWNHGFWRFLLGQIYGLSPDQPLAVHYTDIHTTQCIISLLNAVEQLYQDFYALADQQHTLQHWLDLLQPLFLRHLAQHDTDMARTIYTIIHTTTRQYQPFLSLSIPYNICQHILVHMAQQYSTNFPTVALTRGIVCSSLARLPALPFRLMIFIGMNHSSYPLHKNHAAPYHAVLQPHTTAITPRDHELYALYSHILSATQKVAFFYQDRHGITGATLLPASSLDELQELLQQKLHYSLKPHIVPKSPFDAQLFQPNLPYTRYDRIAFAWWQYASHSKAVPLLASTDIVLDAMPNTDILHLDRLLQFGKNPRQFFFKSILRIPSSTYNNQTETPHEAYELDFFAKRAATEQLIDALMRDPHLSIEPEIAQIFTLAYQKGQISSRQLAQLKQDEHMAMYIQWCKPLQAFLQAHHYSNTVPAGWYPNSTQVGVFQPLNIPYDLGSITLVGYLPQLYYHADQHSFLYIYLNDKKPLDNKKERWAIRDYLGAWLAYVLVTATVPDAKFAWYLGHKPGTKASDMLPSLSQEQAMVILKGLLQAYQLGCTSPSLLHWNKDIEKKMREKDAQEIEHWLEKMAWVCQHHSDAKQWQEQQSFPCVLPSLAEDWPLSDQLLAQHIYRPLWDIE